MNISPPARPRNDQRSQIRERVDISGLAFLRSCRKPPYVRIAAGGPQPRTRAPFPRAIVCATDAVARCVPAASTGRPVPAKRSFAANALEGTLPASAGATRLARAQRLIARSRNSHSWQPAGTRMTGKGSELSGWWSPPRWICFRPPPVEGRSWR